MRRWAHAQGVTCEVQVRRTRGGAVQSDYPDVIGLAGAQLVEARKTRRRKVRRRVQRMHRGHGWISLNDGAEFAMAVTRYLGAAESG